MTNRMTFGPVERTPSSTSRRFQHARETDQMKQKLQRAIDILIESVQDGQQPGINEAEDLLWIRITEAIQLASDQTFEREHW